MKLKNLISYFVDPQHFDEKLATPANLVIFLFFFVSQLGSHSFLIMPDTLFLCLNTYDKQHLQRLQHLLFLKLFCYSILQSLVLECSLEY